MNIRERLRLVPRSYEDFVNYTAARMEEDDLLRHAVMERMDLNPGANSSDILELVADFLGLGEPLEVVDDEDGEVLFVAGDIRAAG